MEFKRGITREVLLIGNWAIKIPSFRSWKLFLSGLLANMQESFWWKATKDKRLCPVLFSVWGGWLLIMKRTRPLDYGYDLDRMDKEKWFDGLPVDFKKDNFGMLRIKAPNTNNTFNCVTDIVVLIDYGS